MNEFWKGVSSIGDLFPEIEKPEDFTPVNPWIAVGKAFRAAGDSLRRAMNDFQTAYSNEPSRFAAPPGTDH